MDLPKTPDWWSVSVPRLYDELGSGTHGLTESAAADRLSRVGPNAFDSNGSPSVAAQVVEKLLNPLILLLLVAGGMSAILGQVTDFLIISAITVMSVVLDVVKEHSARMAAERLKKAVSIEAAAIRGDHLVSVPVAHIVPGDVILLRPGNIVPADGRLIAAEDLTVDQSMLTGESFPQQKDAAASVPARATIEERTNMLFMGTHAVTGSGTMIAVSTGKDTEIGRISKSISGPRVQTAFERGLSGFGMRLARCAMILAPTVFIAHVATGHKPLESVLFVLALVVGFAPELLPIILSITLARGAERMGKKHVIVKDLPAIENFGNMDILCTDKTGTLTENAMTVAKSETAGGNRTDRVRELAAIGSALQAATPSPLDTAILSGAGHYAHGWKKIGEIAFDFSRKRGSVIASDGKTTLLVSKGAPEWLIAHSILYEENGRRLAMTGELRTELLSRIEGWAREGFRSVAVCYKPFDAKRARTATPTDEQGFVFAGILAFTDPPKASARDALAHLKQSGISVRVVTGDDGLVARHVCGELGLEVQGVASESEIDAWSDTELAARVGGITVFSRLTPETKRRVIRAFAAAGHVVGYMGDGINDAPSLTAADIGISVASATDVAKDSADIILLWRDLDVLHDGVIEGRKTFANVMKYIMMGTSSNFGNMISIAFASLVLPFLPLLPTQVLLNDMLYDISQLLLSRDRVDHDVVRHPGNWDVRFVKRFMLVFGPVSSMFDLITFYLLFALFRATPALFQTGWFTESFVTQTVIIFSIRTHMVPFFRSRPDGRFAASLLVMIGIVLALPYTPVGSLFGFVPLPPGFYAALVAVVVAYMALVEVIKHFFYRRAAAFRHHPRPAGEQPVPADARG
jgi:Mg2+-importing ATPase